MITGINVTGSSVYYQRQLTNAKDTTPPVTPTELSPKNSSSDYKVDLSTEKSKIEQEYSSKQTALKQEHDTKVEQLTAQYSREQNKIEQEYTMKKRALTTLNLYA